MKLATIVFGLVAAALTAGSEAGTFVHPPSTHRHLVERTMEKSVLVEFKTVPSVQGGSAQAMEDEKKAFFKSLDDANIEYTVRSTFSTLMNGVSLDIKYSANATAIANLNTVESVFYNYRVPHPLKSAIVLGNRGGAKPELRFAHNMTGVTQVHQDLGLTGKGVKVGIIDTGIDYKHPAFGACAKHGKGCRVGFGHDFVGDDYNEASPDPAKRIPHPTEDPHDCAGHGTHVAGIVGGKDSKFLGVAPDVTLGAYRIFGCDGSTATDIIISAMEKAFADGMDVINLSLGGGSSWPQYPDSKVADRLAKKGLIVAAAMGNDGDQGLWHGSSPGLAKEGLGIASFDNAFYLGRVFQASPDNKEIAFSIDSNSGSLLKDGEIAVSNTDITVDNDGCAPYTGTPFAGKIALIRRGTCPFVDKALNAQAAGAIAVIVYNRVPGALAISVTDPKLKLGVAGVSKEDGEELIKRSAAGAVKVHWVADERVFPNPSGGQISSFSSWGLSPDLAIKPDLGAPGGLIFSSWPLQLGGYNTISGTSMATPYIAGVSALYIGENNDKNGKVDPWEIKEILQNNAVPAKLLDLEVQTPVARQGAGMVNAFHALRGNTRATPSKLALGDDPADGSSIRRTITVTNVGEEPMKYKLTHAAAASVDGSNSEQPKLVNRPATVVISPSTLNLAAGAKKTIEITVTPDKTLGADGHWLFSGYIEITPLSSYQPNPDYNTIYVPYAGHQGNYQNYIVIPTGEESPDLQSLATLGDPAAVIYKLPTETATFTFNKTSSDFPYFRTRLLHPTPKLYFTLNKVENDEVVGYVAYEEYLGITNPAPTEPDYYYSFAWASPDFTAAVRKDPVKKPKEWTPVADGTYYVVGTAEKALGNPKKDKETWRSPKIVVKTK